MLPLPDDYIQDREEVHSFSQYQWGHLASNDSLLRASLIVPSLYLSDMYTATSPTILHKLGITHILCIMNDPNCDYPVERNLEVLCIQSVDSYATKIEEYFDSSTAWIRDVLSDAESKLLVHCALGVSRSATIVIAYLMAAEGMSYSDAFSHVRARREIIDPNDGFRSQLVLLNRRLQGFDTFQEKPVEKHGARRTAGYPKPLASQQPQTT
jgi:atypical dual specificity phosphatase